ncbi:VWA domain-containing protein [Actinomycetota bacterium]
MSQFPFAAIVGADEMALALILTTVSPEVGGVLVRGEKGTAKSTMVRSLTSVLPPEEVVEGCRFGCDPARPDPGCPDGPHAAGESHHTRPARLVELPVGATEDRVIGSLDLRRALGSGEAAFEPGLLADAHRGILYVDEVNLLHDHLVDLLLDAAAMGRNTVERDGVSVSHAARLVLVGTMNPEEGELRPQLLDRFGLTVEVAASRDPAERAEVVRRRLGFDADPEGFTQGYAAEQSALGERIAAARERLAAVRLPDRELERIARVCAGFDVDGMRADIVTARAARAHAAWWERDEVTRDDVRVAARLALPHRRRRNPFDAPGLDEDLLEELLGDDDPEPDGTDPDGSQPDGPEGDDAGDAPEDTDGQAPPEADSAPPAGGPDAPDDRTDPRPDDSHTDQAPEPPDEGQDSADAPEDGRAALPVAVAPTHTAYRTTTFAVSGVGVGAPGRRSRAMTASGRTVGATRQASRRVHLPATIAASAPHQARRGRTDRLLLEADDLRGVVSQGQESNLVLLAVDASGSMGARRRMEEVKTAVLSLLTDAYQRRDRVGLITFRGSEAELSLPPTSSVEAAARCLEAMPHGGRTPLAEGIVLTARVVERERLRDPRRRALVLLLTDGRATGGKDALARARRMADAWPSIGCDAVVIDCETGRFRMGLAGDLAHRMQARHVPLPEVAAQAIVDAVQSARATERAPGHPRGRSAA